jgi:hypothetical protein
MSNFARLLVASTVLAAAPALADHSWSTYHWASDGTVELTVNQAITPEWRTPLNQGIADWEKSRKLSFTQQDVTGVNLKRCSPILGVILVCNDSYGQRGWLGIATIWLSGGHISQGTTQLNDTYFNMPRYNTAAWRRLVACQEVAHDFGLDHQDETFNNVNLGTCMDYTNAPEGGIYNGFDYGPSNVSVNGHDYDQILAIYNHNDETSAAATDFGVREVGRPARALVSSEPAGLSPSEWGRAIDHDAHGRPDTFEKVLAPGQKKITHVFWLPKE